MANTASTLVNVNEEKSNGEASAFKKAWLNKQKTEKMIPSTSRELDEVCLDEVTTYEQIIDETPSMLTSSSVDAQTNDEAQSVVTTSSSSSSLHNEKTEFAKGRKFNWTGITELNIAALCMLLGAWIALLLFSSGCNGVNSVNASATIAVILISIVNIVATFMEEIEQRKVSSHGTEVGKLSNMERHIEGIFAQIEKVLPGCMKTFPAFIVSINFVLWGAMWVYIIAAEFHPSLRPNECNNNFILLLGGLTVTANLR